MAKKGIENLMKYLGQVIEIRCMEWKTFEVTMLIEEEGIFYRVMDRYRFETREDFTYYKVILIVNEEGITMNPLEEAISCMEIYTENEFEDVEGTNKESRWQVGAIIDQLVYDIISSELLSPIDSEDIPEADL
ncbi:MAG: hypothetical protein H7A25_26595 [Leptospiraceae bacterium]|nr:hypothetical protein [Leptospiraceae bacterium]MCP5503497.1 hypothetical protein [Leptospiraceae bacterium]